MDPYLPHRKRTIFTFAVCMALFLILMDTVRIYNNKNLNTKINSFIAVPAQYTPVVFDIEAFLKPILSPSPIPAQAPKPTPKPIPAPETGPVTAGDYIVANLETGEVYASHNTSVVTPIASISKLFTTLVAEANIPLDKKIQITQPMLDVYPDAQGLTLGETFTLSDLLYPLILQSNNNVAEGIAMSYGTSTFFAKMNEFAATHNMPHTHFKDASGLDSGNVSTADDLFTFAQYLYKTRPDLLSFTRTPTYSLATTTDHGAHTFNSTNPFVGDPHFLGGKTGRTDAAQETMFSLFDYQAHGKDYPVAIIVLHSQYNERQVDSEQLLLEEIARINAQS